MQHPAEAYFTNLHQSLGVGVPETSGYPALANLLNAVGESLKPKITAVIHPANNGAGIPDGALFSAKELKKHGHEANTLFGKLKPERGVIEVKPLDKDLSSFESSPQVLNYLESYGQILLTNYRSFATWSWENGKPVRGEHYHFAASETDFYDKSYALRANKEHPEYERLWQFLRRALLANARISTPEDLARFLASYAREARARVEIAPLQSLAAIRKALGESLGISFEGEKGEHFFRSTLIQTLFYGIFSAWVLWHESHPSPKDRFQWRQASYHLGLPVLRSLFVQLADPGKVRHLQLEEILDWTEDCLARVDRFSFFSRYNMGEAVQYFYEPFLAEFDPDLRKSFGVWYTPPEIVKYMVASVDRSLRENFDLPDGLADPRVVVLDPCCGTGAYLVETLRLIHTRLVDSLGEAQAALRIREVACKRLYGFELLPAPYVVSHLQLDLMLTRWGAPLDHAKDERAGVFLTNALTGWVPPETPKDQLLFQEFADERDAADKVKREAEILVIIGNPPYDGYSGISKIEEERSLSEAYGTVKKVAPPQGQGRNELYVRFFRMAERRICEGVPEKDDPTPGPDRPAAKGIVCYISNYSWLDGLSHTGMRERYLEAFDTITIDCLNGDKFETGKKTPEGMPDPSVFSTAKSSVGIKVGTAIALLERLPEHSDQSTEIRFRHWWGKDKTAKLLESIDDADRCSKYEGLLPVLELGLPFKLGKSSSRYFSWTKLSDMLGKPFSGVKTARDQDLVSIDLPSLEKKMKRYFDPTLTHDQIKRESPEIMSSDKRFNATQVREYLCKRGMNPGSFIRYTYRPFDVRWLYWEEETKLLDERRADFKPHIFPGNVGMILAQKTRKGFEPPVVSRAITSYHVIESVSLFYPLYLAELVHPKKTKPTHPDLFAAELPTSGPQPNLSEFAREYLIGLGGQPEELFFHIVAILHSPAYREENAGALRQDWPRVPLPKDVKTLRAGAKLGRRIAALLDPETPVPGVTDMSPAPELKGLGELAVGSGDIPVPTTSPAKADRNVRPPHAQPDLALTARWGYPGQKGVTMPGPGKTTTGTRGEGFLDIHLNATTRWKDVPTEAWNYTLGGYQVLKKWLSYREQTLLRRPLTPDEAEQFTHHTRRITALLAENPALDAHYKAST